jgi:hypothetical protein
MRRVTLHCEQRAEFYLFRNIFSAIRNIILNKTGNVLKLVQPLLHGKAMSITYYECVFVYLVIWQAICMRHFAICCLSGCTIFSHIISHYFSKICRGNSSSIKVCPE